MITRQIMKVQPHNPVGGPAQMDISWIEESDLSSLTAKFVQEWYRNLKEVIQLMHLFYRHPLCLACGHDLDLSAFELHHGIVSQQDIRGWTHPHARALIDTELNLVPLHPHCNSNNPPSREDVWEYQQAFYGLPLLVEWYSGLPWKTERPPRLFRGVEWTKEST